MVRVASAAADLSLLQPASLLKVTVRVGDKHFEALIDTGAEVGLVHPQVLESAGAELSTTERVQVAGVGEEVFTTDGTTRIGLHLHDIFFPPETFHVTTRSQYSIILGANWLRSNGVSVVSAGRQLRFRRPNGAIVSCQLDGGRCVKRIEGAPVTTAKGHRLENGISQVTAVTSEALPTIFACSTCGYSSDGKELLLVESSSSTKFETIPGIINGKSELELLVARVHPKSWSMPEKTCVGTLSSYSAAEHDGPTGPAAPTGTELGHASQEPSFDLPDLDEDQKLEAEAMLQSFKGLFDVNARLGRTTLAPHHIELTNPTPIYHRPRRFPDALAREIQEECDQLELQDIIEPSVSARNSMIIPVRKKDGRIRLCIDCRKVNQVTKSIKFPLPNLTDSVYHLHGAQFFTSLDLVKGYYQLELAEDSRECTAFSTPRGHYQFKKLSFGLKNAPATFQREMQGVLRGLPPGKVIIYIDDILILGDTYEEHLDLVRRTLYTLYKAGIRVNPTKCQWFREEVKFLGHLIGRRGLHKDPAYVEKVLEFPRPQTVRQIREFLGLVNFQRKFLPNCSVISAPLARMTGGKSKQIVTWTPEAETLSNPKGGYG